MKWKAKLIQHKKESRIAVYFENTPELNARIKKLEGVKWSQTLKVWHLPDTAENREKFMLAPAPDTAMGNEKLLQMEQFRRWLQSKRYSSSTIQTYTEALKVFVLYFQKKAISEISNQDLIDFNNDYILKKQLSSAYQNQIVNAIKLFFRTVVHKQLDPELVHRPRREHPLPNVLSKEEVKSLLEAHSNIKHKAMLSLIYSCGLRCGELLQL